MKNQLHTMLKLEFYKFHFIDLFYFIFKNKQQRSFTFHPPPIPPFQEKQKNLQFEIK